VAKEALFLDLQTLRSLKFKVVMATPQNNIKIKKRLTTFALVLALMTGSVAQLAVLLYRGARIIVVSSLSFAAENGFAAREEEGLQQQTIKNVMQ
jgi:hypothetical protein